MDHALDAIYYRTALLLGLVSGEAVHSWAEQAIEREPEPPPGLIELVSVPPIDLSALRSALWPLVAEPEPREVLEALLGLPHADLSFGRCGLTDTLNGLASNAQHVAPSGANICRPKLRSGRVYRLAPASRVIVEWLALFAQSVVDPLESNGG